MIAEASILIERSVDQVFSFIANVENMPRWVSGVRRARLVSRELGEGARFVAEYVAGGRPSEIEFKVTSYAPPSEFATEADRGPFSFRGWLELHAVDGKTEVVNRIDAGPDSLATRFVSLLLGPFLRHSMRSRLRRELEVLKKAIVGTSATQPA